MSTMTDVEIKLLVTLVGVLSSLAGVAVSVGVFIWSEARRRYQGELAALRTLVIVCDAVCASAKAQALATLEFKIEWFMTNSEYLLSNAASFKLLRQLVLRVAELRTLASSKSDTLATIEHLERCKKSAEELLSKSLGSAKRYFLLLPR